MYIPNLAGYIYSIAGIVITIAKHASPAEFVSPFHIKMPYLTKPNNDEIKIIVFIVNHVNVECFIQVKYLTIRARTTCHRYNARSRKFKN